MFLSMQSCSLSERFINLKKEYRDFLRRTVEKINKLNINENLTKQKCMDIYKLYQNIYNEAYKFQSSVK